MTFSHARPATVSSANDEAAQLLALSLDLLSVVGTDGHFRRVNAAFEQTLGWTREELLASSFLDLVHPDDRDATERALAAITAGAAPGSLENRYRCRDGSYRCLVWRAAPPDDTGLLYAAARDVSEQRRMEAALRSSERRYRALIEQSPMSVVIFDRDGRPVASNPAFERITGASLDAVPEGYTAFNDPQLARAGVMKLTERAFAGEAVNFPPLSYDVAALSGCVGRPTWLQSTAYPIRDDAGAVEQVVLVTADVTPQAEAESARRAVDERFRAVQDASPDPFVIWEAVRAPDGTVVDFVLGYANLAFERTFGRPVAELRGRSMMEFFPHARSSGRFESYVRVLETGETTDTVVEYEVDGRWLRLTVVQVAESIAITMSDISPRVQAEQVLRRSREELERLVEERTRELREREERFRSLTENSLDVISILDPDGTVLYGSSAYEKVFGHRLEEVLGTNVFRLVHPDDREETIGIFRRLVERPRETQTAEFRVVRADGTAVWVHAFGQNRLDDPAVRGIVINTRDITTERMAAEAESRAEAMFRGVAQQAITGSYIGQDERIIYGNPKFARIFGYDVDELMELPAMFDLIAPEERDRVRAVVATRLGDGRDVQYTTLGLRKDGSRVPIEVYGSSLELDGRPAAVATVLDISDRVGAETALRESEARFRIAFQQSGIGIALSRPDGRFEKVNPALCQLLGYTEEELLALSFHDVTHADDRANTVVHVRNALAADDPGYTVEKRYVKKCGEVVWIQLTATLHRDGGRPLYFIAQIQDITDRKLAEARLQESEERFDLAVAGASDGIWDWYVSSNEFYCSARWKAQLGYDEHELSASITEWQSRIHPDDLERVRGLLADYLAGRVERFELEHRMRHKDGSYRWILARAGAVRDETGKALRLVGTNTDRTEGKRLEESIAEQARQLAHRNAQLAWQSRELERSNEELERFAYAASHDLQEPLRMVTSFTGLLAKQYEGSLDEKAQQYIHYATDGAMRMRRLIQDLLAYSRAGARDAELVPIESEGVLADVCRNLAEALQESGATITHDPLPTVWADATQLGQVLQNLIGNALKFRGEAAPAIHIGAERDRDVWRFSVRDNGIGIEPRHAERIFVMFQRLHTRAEYPGTGIGLALCRRIIERHGGHIWAQSAPGEGATFHFTLPTAAPSSENTVQLP
jgi:PAS domain S-box-containing protein